MPMKKHVKHFLNRIENEFPNETTFSVLGTTEKIFNAENQPINSDTVIVNKRMTFCIYSCGCNKCQNILGIHIFYGHSSDLNDANQAMKLIRKVKPKIRIVLVHEIDALDDMLQ